MLELEIQIWPKLLVKKVTMECAKIKTYLEASYPCKITKTKVFSPSYSSQCMKMIVLIIEILMGFPYIPDAVLILANVLTLLFFTYFGHSNRKGQLICEKFNNVTRCAKFSFPNIAGNWNYTIMATCTRTIVLRTHLNLLHYLRHILRSTN